MVGIVIINDDFAGNASGFKRRAQMMFDKCRLVPGVHQQAWIVAVMQWLVLDGNCVNADTMCGHPLDVADKVLRITAKMLLQ